MRQISARRLSQLNAQHRVYKLLYVYFDNLPAHCREAWRQRDDGWTLSELRRCDARACTHKETSHAMRSDTETWAGHSAAR